MPEPATGPAMGVGWMGLPLHSAYFNQDELLVLGPNPF